MYVVFDIGGTKTRISYSKDGKELGEVVMRSTPREWSEASSMFDEIFGELSKQDKIEKVVGGLPGVFDHAKGVLTSSPNLIDWVGKPFLEKIENAAKAPVSVFNDTIAAGLGETNYGAGRGFEIVSYITVSTGVGGARIVGGKVDEFRYGFEPGQQIINSDTLETLESAVSGTAFQKKWGADFVHKATESAWDEAARKLAVGIHNTIVHWSPDVVVLGGSMITKPLGIPVPVVLEHLKRITSIFPRVPEIKVAELGEKGGLYGSLVIARGG